LTEEEHVLMTKPAITSSPKHSTANEDAVPHPDILSIFWSEQRQIQEQVRAVCQQGGGSLRRHLNPDMFSYSREYNLLYCRNIKVLASQYFLLVIFLAFPGCLQYLGPQNIQVPYWAIRGRIVRYIAQTDFNISSLYTNDPLPPLLTVNGYLNCNQHLN
jgi:hypothetical protein